MITLYCFYTSLQAAEKGQGAGLRKEGAEELPRESTSDPPFPLSKIDIVTADSDQQKTIKHIRVRGPHSSIIQPTATIVNVDAAAVDGEFSLCKMDLAYFICVALCCEHRGVLQRSLTT